MDVDEEDFEFVVETSLGRRNAVMSKTALGHLSGRNVSDMARVLEQNRALIIDRIERKIARGRPMGNPIRLHGTDL